MLHRRIAILLAAALLLAAAVPALAYAEVPVTIHYTGISLKLDDVYLTPKDAKGAPVNPFVLDGTTYLPIRAVASALGLNVAWEQETQTIRLTSGAAADRTPGAPNTAESFADVVLKYPGITIYLDGEKLVPKDVTGKVVDPFVIDGTTYLPIRAIASALGLTVDWDGETKTVLLYTGTQSETPTDGPGTAAEPAQPAEDAVLTAGTLTDGVYTNEYFGFRCTVPEGWTGADDEALRTAAAELEETGSCTLTLAQKEPLSSITLMFGSPNGLGDLPEDRTAAYEMLIELLLEDGLPLEDVAGLENLKIDAEVGQFAGQEAAIVRIDAPLVIEDVDLGISVSAGFIFILKGPYMMAIFAEDIGAERLDAALSCFAPLG